MPPNHHRADSVAMKQKTEADPVMELKIIGHDEVKDPGRKSLLGWLTWPNAPFWIWEPNILIPSLPLFLCLSLFLSVSLSVCLSVSLCLSVCLSLLTGSNVLMMKIEEKNLDRLNKIISLHLVENSNSEASALGKIDAKLLDRAWSISWSVVICKVELLCDGFSMPHWMVTPAWFVGGDKKVTLYHISLQSGSNKKIISRPWRHFVEFNDKITAVSTMSREKPLVLHNFTTITAKMTLNKEKKRTERGAQCEAWLKALWGDRRQRYYICQFCEIDFRTWCPHSAELADKDEKSFRHQQAQLKKTHGNDKSSSKKALKTKLTFIEQTANAFLYTTIDLHMSKPFTVPASVSGKTST